ncbi:MAG TPA: 3-hydroxyacyl-CoA dehydrogenase NAD-binding domain-containing protein [Steroidobacteraceae bacterium]|nr:3-hydroxyacyl-CoA dehydrogenase NAD-binding domain-containing protein [Steroidobacteraceae bacterium]
MTAITDIADLTLDGEIAVLTLDSPPVNALSASVREGLRLGIERANADPAAKAIVLMCAGRTFIAGADIVEFDGPNLPNFVDALGAVERSAKPVIAAIHGTALGGGLEVALCAHYRIALPSAKCGLPEVTLGLLPGAGGTQRLTRIVGPEKALEIITSGQHLPAQSCLELGIIDELITEDDFRGQAVAFARRVLAEKRPLRKIRDVNDKVSAARGKPEIFADFRRQNARRFRGFKAPEYIIRAIEAAVNLPFDAGMQTEWTLFVELLRSPESAAQRHAFFAERDVWKIPDVGGHTPIIPVYTVGVVGAGTMGGGIAMAFANAGLQVKVVETQQAALDRGLDTIRKNYESNAKSGRVKAEDAQKRIAAIKGSLSLQDLAACDLVVEAVFENMQVKKDLFTQLDGIVKSGAILATNTSALDIDEIATAVKRPESVIGLHFFSPANVMRLVEVVRAGSTSKAVIATAMQLVKRMGKLGVLVRVGPGFVGNRMLYQRQGQADAMVLEGALPWDIDRVLYDFGMPMGPFAMADLAGLDLRWQKETSRGETLREVLCEMDRRGQKTRAGFYDYDENRKPSPSPLVEQAIKGLMAQHGRSPRALSDAEILERCIYPMINEGVKILEEGKAIRASDIDMIWVNGYGWPVYRGGPMFYADTVGLKTIVAKLQQYQPVLGPSFVISPLLERLAAEGKRLRDVK